jgi:hypothetical protein
MMMGIPHRLSSETNSAQPLKSSSSIVGDILHAASGTSFCGVLYVRAGSIYYNQMTVDGIWGDEFLITAGTEAKLAIDVNDHPHIVYTTAGKIGYRMFDGTDWSDEVVIESNHGGSCSNLDVAVDIDGKAHITYTDTYGNTGNYTDRPDIMYATNSSGVFVKSLIFNGFLEYYGGADRYAEYFDKGSLIAVDADGNYYILTHRFQYQTWMGGNDRQYSVVIFSNLGSGSTAIVSSDVFNIYDITSSNDKIVALYAHSGLKSADLVVEGSVINFTNVAGISASSVSSIGLDPLNVAVGGINNTNLFSNFNGLAHTYADVVVKGSEVPIVSIDGTFYAFYTDNADGEIKYKEVVQPASFALFSVPEQIAPAKISIKDKTIALEVPKGADRSSLIATFSASADVTGITVNGVSQISAETANDFTNPITYRIVAGSVENDWLVTVTEAVASSKPEYTVQKVEVYPNPFDTYFSISNPEAVKRVTITNLSGQRVSEVHLKGKSVVITKELKPGVYLINLELVNGEQKAVRMVKK